MVSWFLVVILLLVAGLGFAAHRASLCTVRAVCEVGTSGTAHMLASFGKAALWAALIYGVLLTFFSPDAARFTAFEPRSAALLGAFLFGIGAAVNGACSYSTLQRVADGDLWGLATLAGMGLGILSWSVADSALALTHPITVKVIWLQLGETAPWLLALLGALAAAETIRLWRSRPRGRSLWRLPAASAYRVSTAAAIVGVCAGLLYGLQGAWSYTTTLRRAIDAGYRGLPGPTTLQLLLFAALFAGMLASALQRGSFALRWRNVGSVPARLTGGFMMGVGASVVPGGNDTLLLTGIPALSGWAVAAYGALIVGVFVGLSLRRRVGAPVPKVRCVDGVCVESYDAR